MKKIGIIAEYNPLHNGHLYHFEEVKRLANPNLIITIISSSFTMRGDLSIYDKFTKANQVLMLGSDIVLELPFMYTLERADIFANNTVDFLNLANVDEIWIGSEENNIELYEKCYKNETNISIDNSTSLKRNTLNKYPFSSNDLLGYFYYKRIKDKNYKIELKTIKRIKSSYNSKELESDDIASATSIRYNLDKIKQYCPKFVYENNNILDEKILFPFIKYKLLSSSNNELKNIFMVDEGIENRLLTIDNINSLEELIEYLSNKKYSHTRIKRMLIYILMNITKTDTNEILNNDISFIRVLGFNDIGKDYLNKIKKDIKIYTNIKNTDHLALAIELKISKILDSIYDTNLLELEQRGPLRGEKNDKN